MIEQNTNFLPRKGFNNMLTNDGLTTYARHDAAPPSFKFFQDTKKGYFSVTRLTLPYPFSVRVILQVNQELFLSSYLAYSTNRSYFEYSFIEMKSLEIFHGSVRVLFIEWPKSIV